MSHEFEGSTYFKNGDSISNVYETSWRSGDDASSYWSFDWDRCHSGVVVSSGHKTKADAEKERQFLIDWLDEIV